MGNLFIGGSSWAFTKRASSVAFIRSIVTGHGSGPNERNALALVASLRGKTACRFHTRCRPPASCAKHDPVSFAVQDGLRLLGSVFQGAPSSLFTSLYSRQRHQFVEGTHCAAAWISHREYFWDPHIFCPDVSSPGLHRVIFHSDRSLRYLRLFSRLDFSYDGPQSQ